MRRKDPLERAFELLNADSTELAIDPTLETKLMTELQHQNRPRRFKRLAFTATALLALVLTGGGIAYAAGYDPINLFLIIDISDDGAAQVYDENGNLFDMQFDAVMKADETTADVTIPKSGKYSITLTSPGEQPKTKK